VYNKTKIELEHLTPGVNELNFLIKAWDGGAANAPSYRSGPTIRELSFTELK
jgi:hypothetical protein